ncbi:hypothetical protein L2E82_13456 [Cichorium intybus]|uniref:Uncharacterized protein n=1 Tax=Cichorium intybus TaxID=13427 RepID=A0ACB9EXV8_CICIN|nr:hypothetical protein L2E82_13456 [Cichorium intybus]
MLQTMVQFKSGKFTWTIGISKKVTKVVPPLTDDVKDALVKNIRRMTPQPLKTRADIEMKCFQFDGVLHIKDALRKAEAAGNQACPVKIKLVAPPSYVLITQTVDKVAVDALFWCPKCALIHAIKMVIVLMENVFAFLDSMAMIVAK